MSPKHIQGEIYVDGTWQSSTDTDTIESYNPATGEPIATFPNSSRTDAREAIAAAVDAQNEWAETSAHDRGAYLREAAGVLSDRKEGLSELLTRELGKTIGSARGEVQRAVDLLNYYAEVARDYSGTTTPSTSEHTLNYTQAEPLGTAALITPWNFPIAIPAWKLAPALAAGNTVVFKPASNTPAISASIVEALDEVGVPDGVVNFVTGPGSTVGDEFVVNDNTDVVSFTGSYAVGNRVYHAAAEDGNRVQCEMGGKNPIIVDETADIDLAVELSVGGAYGGAGQACTATSRAIVFESVYDEYLSTLTDTVESMRVGDPSDESVDMGPKVTEDSLEGDLQYIATAKDEGATVAVGGERIDDLEGHFIEPTVLTDVDPHDTIAQEEVFGPVLAVLSVDGWSEAIGVANGVEYGLSASICTNRLDRAKEFAADIQTGVVKINQTSTGVELQMPFGGRKRSSTETFKEQGRQALDFYTHEKAIYMTHFHADE